jgi:putative hydrolase of HD superfamily
MPDRINNIAAFLYRLDELKLVSRRTWISGGARVENSAEHSWHLALACWAFADLLRDTYDVERLIKLALVHDLGEIGAGDTFLYDSNRASAHAAERESVNDIAAHPGNPISDLVCLWEEQEAGTSREARLLKVIDRLLPFLHNINSEGRTWRDNGIHRDQVLKMHAFIAGESPEIHAWLLQKVEYAVSKGWLDAT